MGLADMPMEIILHIMSFARWNKHRPDYRSIKLWSLTCKSLSSCAQVILFSHVIIRRIKTIRALKRVVTGNGKSAGYFKDRVRVLEIYAKDELGADAIHLHDIAQLLPLLTHLRHVALDLDRFYAFLPVSLPLLRHTSETLTSLTVKPSCGWTLLQILERFPSVRRIHYVDQFPNSSSLLNYRPPCPVAFEQIIFTSVSRHGFRPLHWLVSNPDLKLELLEIGSTLPDGVFFDLIISKVGPHLRRLHLYEINDSCIMYLNKCEVLEELVAGCSTPEYDWIPLLQILRSVPVRRLKLVGQSIFPLDDSFPGIFEMLKNLPCIDMVTFAGDDNLSCAFETPEMERHWVKMCRAAGIELNLWHIRDCHEKQYCMESEEVGTSWGMIRPSFGTLTAPQW